MTIEFPHLHAARSTGTSSTPSTTSTSRTSRSCASNGSSPPTVSTSFDVEELPTHGGSLRVYARHADDDKPPVTERRASSCGQREDARRVRATRDYAASATRVEETKRKLLEFLIEAKRAGKTIAGYGAPGKGNTLLNYCGIRTDFLDFTVDRNPYKQGQFLPGHAHPDPSTPTGSRTGGPTTS